MAYNKITVYGESVVDRIQLFDRELSDSEIAEIDFLDRLEWDEYTLMAAEFDEDLNAGSITTLTNPPTKWEIYRKAEGDTVYIKIAEVDMGQLAFYDFSASAQENYTYRINAVNDDERSSPIDTEYIIADFYSWSLISPEDDIVYIFKENIESGDVQIQDDITIEHNLRRKFPTVTFDERGYAIGSLRSFVGNININGERVYSYKYLDTLNDFINDKKPKILKSPNGDVWMVATHKFSYKYYDEVFHHETRSQPAMISFEFVEVSEDFMRYE